MIEGGHVRLRAWREADLDALLGLRNDLALQAELLARPRGSSVSQVRQWLQDKATDPAGLLLVIADRRDDTVLGYLQVMDMQVADQRAEFGICLLTSAQGRGLGTQALTLLMNYLQVVWNISKIMLRVREDNARAISCYERLGFERCGLLRRHVRIDGAFRDVALMETLLEGRSTA